MTSQTSFTLTELTKGLDVTIQGDANCQITGISPIQQAKAGHITFLNNPLYRKYLAETQASAVILANDEVGNCLVNAVISKNPYYIYARISSYFAPQITAPSGVHPSAVVADDACIDSTVSIGAHSVIGRGVKIAANAIIGPGCFIGDNCIIEEEVCLDAKVTLYHDVMIGKRSHISSGVVIGGDGFGFANNSGVWHKISQLGGVRIGEDVDIGANTTIDRGAIENTIIENGVKLDNQIQVGHNVKIGANTIISGCVAISGSTEIGKHCMIGGASCFAGHIKICDGVILTGMSSVTKSITEPGIYSSGIVGAVPNLEFRKNNARFNRLENLMDRVKELETMVKLLTKRETA